jgi:hypothetical protein
MALTVVLKHYSQGHGQLREMLHLLSGLCCMWLCEGKKERKEGRRKGGRKGGERKKE